MLFALIISHLRTYVKLFIANSSVDTCTRMFFIPVFAVECDLKAVCMCLCVMTAKQLTKIIRLTFPMGYQLFQENDQGADRPSHFQEAACCTPGNGSVTRELSPLEREFTWVNLVSLVSLVRISQRGDGEDASIRTEEAPRQMTGLCETHAR